jgi:hypothetical protein
MNNPHPDTDRLRYEIEARTYHYFITERTYWPNNKWQLDMDSKLSSYFNSTGKHIATFRLKAWK